MIRSLFVLTFMAISLLSTPVLAQFGGLSPATIVVDNLTDDQIRQIWTRAQQENMSVEDVLTIGQAQGLPAGEAAKLRSRLNEAAAGRIGGGSASASQGTEVANISIRDEVDAIPVQITSVTRTIDEPDPEPEIAMEQLADETPLPIYGHAIFTDQTLDIFTTTDAARAPDTYVLGTGDQIRVTIFGTSQADLLLEINEDGYVQPSGMPRIFVKGLSMREARLVLRERLSSYYQFRNDEIAITIRTARTITVNIFGETKSRGGFTISALNSAFNALTVAGGPSEIGSVRDIQIIRGAQRRSLDVYQFMQNPTAGMAMDLQHNDIIFVPVAEKIVRISGAVKRPMRYELKSTETLLDLIQFAGGINSDTAPDFVQLQRIVNDEPVLMEWRLDDILAGAEKVDLKDGDIVRIRPISKELERFVEITGSVFYPGRYDIEQNSTLRRLVERAGIRDQAQTDLVFVERRLADQSVRVIPVKLQELVDTDNDFPLERQDNVILFTKERYRNLATIEVSGNVRNPFSRELQFDERLRLGDALQLAGGLLPTASDMAYVFRTDLLNPDFITHIKVDLTQEADFLLQPGDRLAVYNQSLYKDEGELSVSGAVNVEVNTAFDPDLTVTDLLRMTNGFQRGAAINRIDVFRVNISINRGTSYEVITLQADSLMNIHSAPSGFRLQPFDRMVVRRIPEFNIGVSVELSGEIDYAGTYPLENRRIHLSQLIRQAGGLTSVADHHNAIILRRQGALVGPIAVDLDEAMKRSGDPTFDPILFPDDIISVPRFNNTVSIRVNATRVGELQQQGVIENTMDRVNVVFSGRRSAKWYIDNYGGGLAEDADRWSVTVTLPNGEVHGTKRAFYFFKDYPTVEPGSTIALRLKPEELMLEEGKTVDWDQVYNRSIQATTTLLTMLILLNQLK